MNEIVKNEYTEIKKYFDNYYKEQLEVYERKKYYDNYLFTDLDQEPYIWAFGMIVLIVVGVLPEQLTLSGDARNACNYIFFVILGFVILMTILIFLKSILWNFEFKKSKKRFFKHFYKSKNIKKVTTDLGVNKKDLTFDEDNIIIGLNIKDKRRLSKIERELKNGK